jgi:hypothetical protein
MGFGVIVSLPGQVLLGDGTPLPYTDSNGNALQKGTLVLSQVIDINSQGGYASLSIKWTAGSGLLHIRRLVFNNQANDTSHYIMEAAWQQALNASTSYTAKLDVIGQRDMSDAMHFRFYVANPVMVNPQINLTWKPARGTVWNSTQAYYPGDQVLYGGNYYEATDYIPVNNPPLYNANWKYLNPEPQIPLLVESLHLQKWMVMSPTPMTSGNEGFRQDMVERALRSDQDAYRASITSVGSNYPEFRVANSGGYSWERDSTEAWMRFQESYNPRLREMQAVSGNIAEGRYYEVRGPSGNVTYNAVVYPVGSKFYGVAGQTTFVTGGFASLWQIGAYRQSLAGDVGQPALVPAGLEFVLSAGTVAGWYASYASYPTIQALQPWMIEKGMYVTQPEFWSPPTM